MSFLRCNIHKVKKSYQFFLVGVVLLFSHSVYAVCDADTLECKNQRIEDLRQQVQTLEIYNAELRYDNDDLSERLKATKKKLDLCSINLKNVTVEIQSCGK